MRAAAVVAFALGAAVTLGLGLAACFGEPGTRCAIRCGASATAPCPGALTCGADDFCHAVGEPATCGGGGGADASLDIDAGGGGSDAGVACGFDLAAGTHSGTAYLPATSRIALGGSAASGQWDSAIVDLGATTSVTRLAWRSARPSLSPLPAARAVESGYETGNADMSSNRLLLHLDERSGVSFADASGGGHAGACVTCPSLAEAGAMGRGVAFDALGERIELADDAELEPSAAFTLEVWGRVDGEGAGNTGMFATKGVTGGGPPFASYSLEVDHAMMPLYRLKCYAALGGGLTVFGTTAFAPGLSPPFHAACVYDGTTLAIHVNGVLEGSAPASGPVAYGLGVDDFFVGMWGGGGQNLVGLVDEIAVYAAALSGPAVRDRFLRGALRLEWQVRSCDDAACSGEEFVGPDGTALTRYDGACAEPGYPPALALNDLDCNGDGAPDDGADLAVPPGRYVQVRAFLARNGAPAFTPEVLGVSVCP